MKEIQLKYFRFEWKSYLSYDYTEFMIYDKKYISDIDHTHVYFNNEFYVHRDDGYAAINRNNDFSRQFYINGINYQSLKFAKLTKHTICKYCENFCNQKCF